MYKQSKLINKKGIIFGIFIVMCNGTALAASLTTPNTFAPGEAATAATVNANFTAIESAVNDNNTNISNNTDAIAGQATRISSIESSTTATDFSGYGLPFAADGAAKNVVVQSDIDPANGDIRYYVRSRYENSSETISIDGVDTVVPFIANYSFVRTSSSGTLLFVNKSIEAPETVDYNAWQREGSSYDVNSLTKTVEEDTLHDDQQCRGGSVQLCIVTRTLSATGDYVSNWRNSRLQALMGPYTVNGLTFPDVVIHERFGSDQTRLRAKGIGEIMRVVGGGQNPNSFRRVIYYRVNGASGGSLTGTPFEAGQPLDGLFF